MKNAPIVTVDSEFIFQGYDDDIQNGEIRFHYRLVRGNTQYNFTETLRFVAPSQSRLNAINKDLLQRILQSLHIILGISYWKLSCSKRIRIDSYALNKLQAAYWNTVYTKGLGELFYKNSIDYRNLIHFPSKPAIIPHLSQNFRDRSLVLLGAGKDSIVTVELLKKHKKDFSVLTLGALPIHQNLIQQMDVPCYMIERSIDPKLFELNRVVGMYNGHIPISAIYAFVGMFAAVLYDFRYVIASNEASANFGNVSYLGNEINHQWSKSLEFEGLLQSYTKQYLSDSLRYFSLLRPLTEAHIAKLFVTNTKYFNSFSSCNKNFTLTGNRPENKWCSQCAKCAFAFLLLAAYLPKKVVTSIFHKNLLADMDLLPLYEELLGCKGFKPFDCVGTPTETLAMFELIQQKREYAGDGIIRAVSADIDMLKKKYPRAMESTFQVSSLHSIPKEFYTLVENI